jgi:hypothetical protein
MKVLIRKKIFYQIKNNKLSIFNTNQEIIYLFFKLK